MTAAEAPGGDSRLGSYCFKGHFLDSGSRQA